MSPDHRQHRGAHPEDKRLFAPERLAVLRTATAEMSWLLSRGYAPTASLKLVGDRYGLQERQRVAISRAACADASLDRRRATRLGADCIRDADLVVDGFNLLITIEAALGGGVILHCRDTCLRDLASVHGTYKAVLETDTALDLIGNLLETQQPRSVEWLFDRPISNSGRLAQRVRDRAAEHGWPWSADVVFNPDADIRASDKIAISSDSAILDGATRWINLSAHLIPQSLPDAWLIDLHEQSSSP